jgi:hypothetical protein
MKRKFHCTNADCRFGQSKDIVFEVEQEAWMDENNIATIFCPQCKKKLVVSDEVEVSNSK